MNSTSPMPYASTATMGPPPELEWIPVSQMFVDPEYQRSTETANGRNLIEAIAREFQWAKFQVIVVTRRPDGMYALIDGQHRRAAAVKCGLESLPCLVVSPGSLAAEADIFVSVNSGRVSVQPYEMFWSKLAAGRPDAVAVKAVCDEAGVTIPRSLPKASNTSHKRLSIPPKATIAIAAISASIRLYGAQNTVTILRLLVDAFPDKGGQIRQGVIKGLGVLLKQKTLKIGRTNLVAALARHDVVALEAAAAATKDAFGNRTDLAMAAQIAKICEPIAPIPATTTVTPALPPARPAPSAAAVAAARYFMTASPAKDPSAQSSKTVVPAINKSIATCTCKRQFRPEYPDQQKCNICRKGINASDSTS